MTKNFLTISELVKEINELLDEVEQEECDCNEGSLSMNLDSIKHYLDLIDKQWTLHKMIWELDYEKDI